MPPRTASRPAASPQPTDLPDLEQLSPPPRPSGPLTFAQPTTDPSDQPEPSPSLSDELPDELPDPSDEPPTSSRASSGSGTTSTPEVKRLIRDAARAAVLVLGTFAHAALARDEVAQAVELGLADADDAEAIGDPLANLANRRVGPVGAAASPDAADVIMAVVGIVTYGLKQFGKWQAARDLRKNAPSQGDAERLSQVPEGDPSSNGFQPLSVPQTGPAGS